MIYLKEDGSLDIDKINNLPIEEYIEVVENMTDEQYHYYVSTSPINDGSQHTKAIPVDYTMEDEIKRGTGVLAEDFLNNLKKYLKND